MNRSVKKTKVSRGGYSCAVKTCRNISTKKGGRAISFFSFPKDHERATLWVAQIQRYDLKHKDSETLHKNFRVCSKHFTSNMFMNDLKNRLFPYAYPVLDHDKEEKKSGLNGKMKINKEILEETMKEEKSEVTINDDFFVAVLSLPAPSKELPVKDPYDSTCRVCLETSKKMYPLKGPIMHCELDVYKMIACCVGEEVELSVDLPQKVCCPCYRIIRMAYNLVKQYKVSQKTLAEKRLENAKNSQEQDLHTADTNDPNRQDPLSGPENVEENTETVQENAETMKENTEGMEDNTETMEENTLEENSESMEDNNETIEENSEAMYPSDQEEAYDQNLEDQVEEDEEEENIHIKIEPDTHGVQVKTENFTNESEGTEEMSNILRDLIKQDNIEIEEAYLEEGGMYRDDQNDHSYTSQNYVEEPTQNEVKRVQKYIPILPKNSSAKAVLVTKPISEVTQVKKLQIIPIGQNMVKLVPVDAANQSELPTNSTLTKRPLVRKKIIINKRVKDQRIRQNAESLLEKDNQTNNKVVILKYHCPICPNVVFIGRELRFSQHVMNVHKNDRISCNRCSIGDLTAAEYLEHYSKSHTYECPECKKTFRTKHHLSNHMRRHLNIRYHCTRSGCNKSFAMKFSLHKHLEEHEGAAKYVCPQCGHISTTYDTHNYHVRRHAGRKFLCTECGQTFVQSSHLKAHMWKHTGLKVFKCDKCTNSYTSIGSLKKHKRKYH